MATSSSGSSNSKDFEDFISEVQDIEKGKAQDDSGDDDTKTPDEGEQEAAWLKDAGFPHLATKFEEGKELKDDIISRETSSLTKPQAAAVKKRVDTLNATLRKKQKQKDKQKADVRDLFTPSQVEGDGAEPTSRSNRLAPDDTDAGKVQPHMGSFRAMGLNRGEYSMKGGSNVVEETGIETISIQSKGQPESRHIQVKSSQSSVAVVSDSDVALNFAVDGPRVSPVPRRHQTESKDSADKHGLPNFVLVKDVLGVTSIDDLCEADVKKVRALALIELTALFDRNNITYSHRKPKKRLKDHGVYGVPLQTLLEHDQKKWPHLHLKVPRIFRELVQFLDRTGIQEEGILRVPGSIARIKLLREEIEKRFNNDQFSWEEVWCNDAAGLLKQFIRELPAPLLTFEYLEAFAQVDSIPDRMQQLQALNLLVLLLPDVHRRTLLILLRFLKKVVDHEGNKMTVNSVAMIMAPNLFLVASGKKNKDKEVQFHMATGTATIVRMLIKYQHIQWTVPSFMMQQVRHQYEADQLRKARDKSNSIMKFWGKKDKSDAYKKPVIQHESDYQEGVIRVQVPHLTSYHTAVQLNASTTATDVIQKFQRRSFVQQASVKEQKNNKHDKKHDRGDSGIPQDANFSTDTMALYEFGGNIGERKLDPNTNMLALLRVNPNAEWIIRPVRPD